VDLDTLEAFALADDRERVLEQLIPGTEDHYHHRCLLLGQRGGEGDWEELARLLRAWADKHGRTTRFQQTVDRVALLRWDAEPEESAEHLRRRLGVRHDHQQVVEGKATSYPTRLDGEALSRRAREEARSYSDLSTATDLGLERLLDADGDEALDGDRRRALLGRLQRPDHPRVVALVLADLEDPYGGSFGGLGVHGRLLLSQLEELAQLRPALLQEPTFVDTWLDRLQPDPEVEWEHDLDARVAYLARMWELVGRLAPAFNPLKAHVLHHWLDADRRAGRFDRERFLAYLRLPRPTSYANPDYLEEKAHRSHLARLDETFAGSRFPAVHDDEPLVRALLSEVLLEGEEFQGLDAYVRRDYLRRLRAEARILAGVGDMERWYSELDDPAGYQALKERVEIEFAPTMPTPYAVEDPVRLEVDVKNVETLVVKVFRINAFNVYRATGRDVDTTIDLDGLVAAEEQTHRFEEPPLRRVRRAFELPSLAEAGVYVVELIGGGRSSRALIRKGALRYVERVGAAGHAFTIVDEAGRRVPEATLWLGGREHRAGAEGEVVVPFTTSPRTQAILLRHGGRTSVDTFRHQAEELRFSAGIHVDREGLLGGRTCQVLVRPQLRVAGHPVSLKLLEDPKLRIESTDLEGTAATQEVSGFELFADRESVHSFQVPEDLAEIAFTVEATLRPVTGGGPRTVSAERRYALNGIERTNQTEALHLARPEGGYVAHVLGKAGEPRGGVPVTFTFVHEETKATLQSILQTDEAGRIELGELPGVTRVDAQVRGSGVGGGWSLRPEAALRPRTLHAVAGETLRVPHVGPERSVDRSWVSLLELRGEGYLADRSDRLTVEDDHLLLKDLPAGVYELFLRRSQETLTVRVAAGRVDGGWVLGPRSLLQRRAGDPLHMGQAQVEGERVRARVHGVTPRTRVHVLASRYQGDHDAFGELAPLGLAGVTRVPPHVEVSHYVSGRDIGEEYRYVLERRYAQRRPGNLLTRPGLLLNPWSLRDTDTAVDRADLGGAYAQKSAPPRVAAMAAPAGRAHSAGGAGEGAPSLEFLAQPAVVIPNLTPDADGWVQVPRGALEGTNEVRFVAVDGVQAVWRRAGLPEATQPHRDTRLQPGLDPEGHFSKKKQVSLLQAGESLMVEDITTTTLEHYDTLGKVHRLYTALCDDEHLRTFAFVTRWHTLTRQEKCTKLSEYGCHELHLFVARKDPELFAEVLKPYLANKRHKTFMDRYLLGEDVRGYLRPWAHGRLNAVERILLGEALEQERAAAERHTSDRVDLLGPDPEEDQRLFRAAVQGSALEAEDALGFGAAASMQIMASGFGGAMPAMEMARGGSGSKKAKRARRSRSGPPGAPPPPPSAPEPMESLEEEWEDEADEGLADADMDFFADEVSKEDLDLGRRSEQRQLFRQLEATQELAENDYYKRTVAEQGPELVLANRFWRDFARHTGGGPFLSKHLAEPHRNFTEAMLALAVLDLPFEAGAPKADYDGARMVLTAAGPTVVFHEEIKPAEPAEQTLPILVSQNVFRADDRYRHEGGERFDKYAEEVLIHVVYVVQVVLTNPTSAPHKLDLLLQIPQGAIPVQNGFRTKGRHVHLGPYATQSIEYSFYFPLPGTFGHFPVHVAKDERLVASAEARALEVLLEPSRVDTTSWAYVSQHGTEEQVLAFLEAENVERLDLDQIAWRMRDQAFFQRALELLRGRRAYARTLWGYGIHHRDEQAVGELLEHESSYLDGVGDRLESPLLNLDPVARGRYQHLEYAPLVNARAHRLGAKLKILNDRFAAQYRRAVEVLTSAPTLTSPDWLAVAYYQLLQDRVEEGLEALDRVDPSQVASQLQLDYLRAYVAFFGEDPEGARSLAERHEDHPIDRWRKLFRGVLAQLDEAKGGASQVVDADDRDQRQAQLAASEPSLELEVEGREVLVRSQNLASCTLNLYAMDVELLFSRQPFVQQQTDQFGFIAPNGKVEVELPGGARPAETRVELPDSYRSTNVVVEAVAGGVSRSRVRYANELAVQVVEGYGHVRVAHTDGRPLPAVYVKVYARKGGGQVRFYKDGYTDLRGRFDYASLSTGELDGVERFALLILSDDHGAVIREADPPSR
jgi:hypothetical protein